MNISQDWENFTSTDKLIFQNCCRKLLGKTFLVRDKQADRKHYFFVVKYMDIFLEYFLLMGFEIKCDKDNGVVMLDNCSGIDKQKLISNRYRFTNEETIVLCCLWLIYVSRIKEGTLSSVIMIGVSDLVYELEKYNVRDMVKKTGLGNIVTVLKRYSLVDLDGNIGDIDCKLILYPSLQFALDTDEFSRFVKEVVQVVVEGKDNLEEETDEQSDDFE